MRLGWQTRFVNLRLEDATLVYYKSRAEFESRKPPKGEIPLADAEIVVPKRSLAAKVSLGLGGEQAIFIINWLILYT